MWFSKDVATRIMTVIWFLNFDKVYPIMEKFLSQIFLIYILSCWITQPYFVLSDMNILIVESLMLEILF